MGTMRIEVLKMQKRSPSAHQKQMRFFTIFFATLFVTVFAAAFYFVARWLSTSHMVG
jgi:hypothetical protein